MTSYPSPRKYLLPGGKASVGTRRAQIASIVRGASLFGPKYVKLLREARSGNRHRLHAAEREWTAQAARAVRLTVDVHGEHRIDPSEQYVVVPLHEGFADVLALSRLPLDLSYTVTEELLDWKLLGRYLTASGQCAVSVRNGAAAYRAMLRDSERAFSHHESYVVFPQGSILGIEVAFHQGAFRLAAHTGRPLLPIVLTGGATIWEYPYSSDLHFDRTIRMEILEPVSSKEVLGRSGEIEADMKQRALAATPQPRHFDPDNDGWWDGYPYEIDPAFPELADRVADHRKMSHITRQVAHGEEISIASDVHRSTGS
jgi:1-acyl-sn-glycerol-3-phosphate acyltransferase